jgi:hypothetical protein
MKVYVLKESVDFESGRIEGVVDSKEKAKAWCMKAVTFIHEDNYYSNFPIEDLPYGKKILDIAYTYEEWEVT